MIVYISVTCDEDHWKILAFQVLYRPQPKGNKLQKGVSRKNKVMEEIMKSTDIAVLMVVVWFIVLNIIAVYFAFDAKKNISQPQKSEFRMEYQKSAK